MSSQENNGADGVRACPVRSCPNCRRSDTFVLQGEQFIQASQTRIRFFKCSRCGFGLSAISRGRDGGK